MDNYKRYTRQVVWLLFSYFLLLGILVIGGWIIGTKVFALSDTILLLILGGLILLSSVCLALIAAPIVTRPLLLIQQAILHVSPKHAGTAPPNLEESRMGRELITSLALQVYQFASTVGAVPHASTNDKLVPVTVAHSIPLPAVAIDKNQNIVFASDVFGTYLGQSSQTLTGQNIYSVLNLSFPTNHTLDAWLALCRANKATASESWDHVRISRSEQAEPLQCDLTAYYTKDSPSGIETILTLFDNTTRYTQEDRQISFVALAVHELRTPLTIMRGYIEVFEEEFEGKLTTELAGFMHKMQAASQQLAAFVNNILNVARVESNQLSLTLHEAKWADIVQNAVNDLTLRAQVHNKTIAVAIAPDLPTVAVDRVSAYEVLINLLDNAIKYSGDEPKNIVVTSRMGNDGMVETTIQDFGVGIPESVIANLFERFYRNHRTMAQVGGTGLGLYLSKAIVEAHGGHIWVRSKVGEGSTFGFTLQPYTMLAAEQKNSDNKDIVRNAHGWIKNHSLYRR